MVEVIEKGKGYVDVDGRVEGGEGGPTDDYSGDRPQPVRMQAVSE